MKRVKQRGSSDCFSACLASVLEVPLKEVPNFCDMQESGNGNWHKAFLRWCRKMGYKVVERSGRPHLRVRKMRGLEKALSHYVYDGPCFKGFYHARVGLNGERVHDPAGFNGIMTSIRCFYFFVPIKKRGRGSSGRNRVGKRTR